MKSSSPISLRRSLPRVLFSPSWCGSIANGRYQLIAGERRLLASQKAGKTAIPAVLRQVSDEQAMEMTIVENLQRTDLNPMEQARAYDRLSREFKMTQEQMATRTGKDRASVANFLRLLRLPTEIQGKVEEGELSFGHARTLLALESPEGHAEGCAESLRAFHVCSPRPRPMFRACCIRRKRAQSRSPKNFSIRMYGMLATGFQRALGLRVKIEDRNGRGRVIIEYSRLEDFDTLLETLLGH